MFFDAKAARARIEARGATPADLPAATAISGLAGLARGMAEIEKMQTPSQFPKPAPQPPQKPSAETFPHGQSFTGQPKTWTGRIVSVEEWRTLTDWDRNGPNGQMWNGITRRWE